MMQFEIIGPRVEMYKYEPGFTTEGLSRQER
jgi:hypothetical protein